MTTQHTPTPWIDGNTDGDCAVLREDGSFLFEAATPGDAAFIVRACNAHERLMDAVRWASKSPHHPSCPNDGQRCYCHVGAARAALAAAEE